MPGKVISPLSGVLKNTLLSAAGMRRIENHTCV